jgi:hypothetical protein
MVRAPSTSYLTSPRRQLSVGNGEILLGVLERFEENIDKADFPCEELDNEFVKFAE